MSVAFQQAFGGYYDTLPSGVRMMALKQVKTGKINSSFTGNSQEKNYDVKVNMDASSLENLNSITKEIFSTLKNISPQAYDNFSFGEYEIKGSAEVMVRGAGFAYGLNNRLTGYLTFPWYEGKVNLDIDRTKLNNHPEVTNLLQNSGNTAEAQIFADFAAQLPDATGELLQSVIVNYFGYKPLGDWKGQAMGDVELGMIYRLTDWYYSGLALSGGVVLPTGREDDPDMLQDYGFGDGQPDIFLEFGGGFMIPGTGLSFDSWARYTYQIPVEKELRIPEDEDYPLGSEKGLFDEKLGNIFDWNFQTTMDFSHWIGVSGTYAYSFREESDYQSPYTEANRILEQDTLQESHTLKGSVHFSTVSAYKKGIFALPFKTNLSAQKIVTGRNIPKYTRYDLEFRFFF